jgi:hypothetical protein
MKWPNSRFCIQWLTTCIAVVITTYLPYVSVTWLTYGRSLAVAADEDAEQVLDNFMPVYDVAGRQHVRVAAPAETTFSAACKMNLKQSVTVPTIFKTRALLLGGVWQPEKGRPMGIVEQARLRGWGILAEDPGREIVFGAVTQAWVPDPVFRALAPTDFAQFHAPGYVKIAWTLRVDPVDSMQSIARTETRVATTDPVSRAKFRRYWAFFSPGMFLIRWASLRIVRAEAERAAHQLTAANEANSVPRTLLVIAALLLILHGLIHLMGTAVYACGAEIKGLNYKTTVFGGRWDLGASGISVFGWLWVLPAIEFVAAALALLVGSDASKLLLLGAALLSLVLILLDWGSAFRGAIIDVVILALVWLSRGIQKWFS